MKLFQYVLLAFLMALWSEGSLQAQPKNSLHTDQGNAFAKQGNFDQALQSLNQAISLNPSDARSYKLRGHVYYAMGDYTNALADLDSVCALVPDSANALVDRAIVYSVMGKHGLALADVERALALKPNSSFAQAVRQEVLKRADQ